MWMGTLTFGLVSVPVKLYSAVTSRSVHFHQLHRADHARIYTKRFCPVEEEEVAYEDIVKGYEVAPERYVVVEPEELAALEPAYTRTIDIEDFVRFEDIDPIYFDQPYIVVPNKGGARSYKLLFEAMSDTGKVAIARVVLRSRERLVAIRPRANALLMTTMSFADEIQSPQALRELEDTENTPVSEKELAVAKRLVESISESFDITKYRDTYREALLDLIDRKASGEEIVVEPAPKHEPSSTPDLMGALQASLEDVRKRQGAGAPAAGAARGNGARGGGAAKKKPAALAAKKPAAKKPAAKKPAKPKPRS